MSRRHDPPEAYSSSEELALVSPILILCVAILVCLVVPPLGAAVAGAARLALADISSLLYAGGVLVCLSLTWALLCGIVELIDGVFERHLGGVLIKACGLLAVAALLSGLVWSVGLPQAYSKIEQMPAPAHAAQRTDR